MLEVIVGSSNPHKVQEITQICRAIPNLRVIPFSDREPLPDIEEDGDTFADNAGKKALLLAQYLYARRGANASGIHTAIDSDDDELDQLAAARARRQAEDMLGLRKADASRSSRRRNIGREQARLRSTDVLVLADDSGIVVEALGGKPGVLSARYAGKHGDDEANNRKLLSELEGVPDDKRKAHFACAIALANQNGVLLTTEGRVNGRITTSPRGNSGFGYDPLFFYEPYGKTFGETPAEMKNAVSHRANALREFQAEFASLLKQEGLI